MKFIGSLCLIPAFFVAGGDVEAGADVEHCMLGHRDESRAENCLRTEACCTKAGGVFKCGKLTGAYYCDVPSTQKRTFESCAEGDEDMTSHCNINVLKNVMPYDEWNPSLVGRCGTEACAEIGKIEKSYETGMKLETGMKVENGPKKRPSGGKYYPDWGFPSFAPGKTWGCDAYHEFDYEPCSIVRVCCEKMGQQLACDSKWGIYYCPGSDHYDWNLWYDCVTTIFNWTWTAECSTYWPPVNSTSTGLLMDGEHQGRNPMNLNCNLGKECPYPTRPTYGQWDYPTDLTPRTMI